MVLYNPGNYPMNNVPNQYNINPNPMGNILNIGSQGYNGGYYNNMYNNYYNPYLAMKQQQQAEAMFKEQQRQQSDIMKKISRAVNKSSGYDISEESLNSLYDYKEPEQYKVDTESVEYMQSYVTNLHLNGYQYTPQEIAYVNHFNSQYDKSKQQYPDDISMYDFHIKMSENYVDMLLEKEKEKQKDVSKLYNNDDYRKLLNMNSNNNTYFNSIFNGGNNNQNNVSIDDMEISLPNHLANEYQSRRKQFLDAILNKG